MPLTFADLERMPDDGINVVVPDVVFLTAAQVERLDLDAHLNFAPALVVDIASRVSWSYDLAIKRAFYERIGVLEHWIQTLW